MTTIPVIEDEAGNFSEFLPAQLESRDGKRVAPVGVVLHPSWTDEERAEFGVFLAVAADVAEGMIVTASRFERVDGQVLQRVEVAPAPIVVPASVTPRQLRLALLAAGKLGQVTEFVGSGQAPEAAVISWEYATEFLRSDPMLGQFAAMLGMSDDDVDGLFVAAARIP